MPVDLLRTLLASLILVCLVPEVRAQTSVGELTGRVADSTGRLVSDILIVVEDEDGCDEAQRRRKGVCRWETASGYQGSFFVAQLPPARYRVTILLGYFKPYERVIEIRRGTNAFLDVSLELRGEEHVQVDIPATLVQPVTLESASLSGTTFSRADIDSLPLANGRTLQSFWSLVPGIVFTDSVGTLAQFTTMGQRRFANRLTIDGMSADLAADVRGTGVGEAGSGALPAAAVSGGTQILVPLDAIAEIQVRTTNAPPEHARSTGAQTAIVTRAGGDRLSGAAFINSRPDRFAAANWFSNAGEAPERESSLWNSGISLGGPVVKKRLNYFAAWEQQRINRATRTTINVPSDAIRAAAPERWRPFLDAFPRPNGAETGDGLAEYSNKFPAASRLWTLSGRVDANLSSEHRLFTRINRARSVGDALTPPQQTPFMAYASREDTSTTTLTLGAASQVSASLANDVRLNVTSHRGAATALPAPYGDAQLFPIGDLAPTAPSDTWVHLAMFLGPNGAVATGRTAANIQRQFQFSDTLSVSRGRHEWRLGLEHSRVTASSDAAPNRYAYQFASIEQFLQGRARQVTIQHVMPWRVERQSWAAFVQDRVRVTPRLSLEFGARYSIRPTPTSPVPPTLVDFEALPAVVLRAVGTTPWPTSHNVAPRLQIAYQRGGSLVHAGWSVVFDELTSPGLAEFSDGYPYLTTRSLIPVTFPLEAGELASDALPPFAEDDRSTYYAFSPDLRPSHLHQWRVGLDQGLGRTQRASLSYAGTAGRDLVYRQAFYGSASTLRPEVRAYTNDAQSNYHALLLAYVVRPSSRINGRVSYTWSHSVDTDSGETLGPQAPASVLPLSSNRGPSDFDRRHVFQAIATYQLPALRRLPVPVRLLCADWQIDVMVSVRSGAPVSVETVRIVNGGRYTLRPDLVPGLSVWLEDATVPTGRRLNAAAFRPATEMRQGTLGRNALRASPLRQVDLSLSRTVRLSGRLTTQFRIEAFNVLNVTNFGPPSTLADPRLFGRPIQTYADALGTGTLGQGGLPPLQQQGGSRAIQLGIRLGY